MYTCFCINIVVHHGCDSVHALLLVCPLHPVADLQLSPVKALVSDIKSVSCGVDFTVWLTNKGEVFSAGNPQYGQLGHGTDHMYNAKDSKYLAEAVDK